MRMCNSMRPSLFAQAKIVHRPGISEVQRLTGFPSDKKHPFSTIIAFLNSSNINIARFVERGYDDSHFGVVPES